jgi:hypothetical protein
MPTMQQFYLIRAAEAKHDADAATLANVRDRFLVAASTWTGLAARAGRVDKMIAGQLAEKRAAQLVAAAPAWR